MKSQEVMSSFPARRLRKTNSVAMDTKDEDKTEMKMSSIMAEMEIDGLL